MSNKIAISEFKTHCLDLLDKVQKNNNSIIITKRNQPIAIVSPIPTTQKELFGALKSKAFICADIIQPIDQAWNAEND